MPLDIYGFNGTMEYIIDYAVWISTHAPCVYIQVYTQYVYVHTCMRKYTINAWDTHDMHVQSGVLILEAMCVFILCMYNGYCCCLYCRQDTKELY